MKDKTNDGYSILRTSGLAPFIADPERAKKTGALPLKAVPLVIPKRHQERDL